MWRQKSWAVQHPPHPLSPSLYPNPFISLHHLTFISGVDSATIHMPLCPHLTLCHPGPRRTRATASTCKSCHSTALLGTLQSHLDYVKMSPWPSGLQNLLTASVSNFVSWSRFARRTGRRMWCCTQDFAKGRKWTQVGQGQYTQTSASLFLLFLRQSH
jgi:hypothetical protein